MFGVKFTLNLLLLRLLKPIGFPNSPFQKRDSHFLNERFLKSQPRCNSSAFCALKEKGAVVTWGGHTNNPMQGGEDSSAVAAQLQEGVHLTHLQIIRIEAFLDFLIYNSFHWQVI